MRLRLLEFDVIELPRQRDRDFVRGQIQIVRLIKFGDPRCAHLQGLMLGPLPVGVHGEIFERSIDDLSLQLWILRFHLAHIRAERPARSQGIIGPDFEVVLARRECIPAGDQLTRRDRGQRQQATLMAQVGLIHGAVL